MEQMVDRISILPNDLLCHILSFLQIRQTPLCYSLSALRIAYVRFCRFVDTLKTFRLKCVSRTPIQNMWLEAAKCRRVEELQDMKISICSNVMPSEKSLIVEELSSCSCPKRCKLSFEHKYCY
ncbi:hypothetical protein MtrunA17_Chr7g0246751 [Medicago truncatula]|uniref:Cyclin-like F-box n=2 Tax=Medicago truncatula TaxID=3880 RepID=A2Q3Q4_MEDTR|nr:Cyclin-like F-box [Medicago truncatula]RHN46861.1 hypothetical protein MtrunA17_Chr7g0246751 [Medicago truncatula]